MTNKALITALVAFGLFVVTIAADASMNRSFALDASDGKGGWILGADHGDATSRPTGTPGAIPYQENDTIDLRLRVENGYPWAFSEAYSVRYNGVEVASGTLQADARATGTSTFRFDTSRLDSGPQGRDNAVKSAFVYLEITIGSTVIYTDLTLTTEVNA